MSQKEYIRALNNEIQKLNGIIDHKIMMNHNYKREALRHKELLRQLRREKQAKSIFNHFRYILSNA